MRSRAWAAVVVTAILGLIPAQIVIEDVADQQPYPNWYGPDFDAQRPAGDGFKVRRPELVAVYADGRSEQVLRGEVLKGLVSPRGLMVFDKWFLDGLANDARLVEQCHRVKPYQRNVAGCTRSGHPFLSDEATLAYLRRNLPGVRTLVVRWEAFTAPTDDTAVPARTTTMLEFEVAL